MGFAGTGQQISFTEMGIVRIANDKVAETWATQFSRLIHRFFSTSTQDLIPTSAFIDRLVGDEVIALFLPGFVSDDHAKVALRAAESILAATGHTDSDGPWIPLGVGLHTGTAFVGKVGEEGLTDITVLGDAANVTAGLAGLAGKGEILLSDPAYQSAGSPAEGVEARNLELKCRPNRSWAGHA